MSADNHLQLATETAYRTALENRDGALADYIPELTKANPEHFGLALVTTNGQVFSAGDVSVPFTIQSVSKAFSYCLALEWAGKEVVRSRVGVEPSGDTFNAIVFDPVHGRPYNPMVNAGAIAVAGVLHEVAGDAALARVLDRLSTAAGRTLDIDDAVYRSEASTGHRNRAIAHLLRASGAMSDAVEASVDLYFRLCSLRVTALDLAHMGATLANIGTQPASGEEVFDLRAVRDTLAVMSSCGMYDYSGEWACDVGIPAKSGVGGGVMGVVNRQLGVATFAPRLDRKGNSVRGVQALRMLSDELGLHAFDCTNAGSAMLGHLISSLR
jgi:glutaminase